MTPKVSVITPVYGVEKYIAKCVESLFNQTLDDVEFIFINDATQDRSMEILQEIVVKYPHRDIKIINQPSNMGSAVARRTGIDNATGVYSIQIDSDDWCELDMLEQMYNKAITENADIVVADYFSNFRNNVQTYNSVSISSDGKECVKLSMCAQLNGALWNKLIKHSLYKQNNITFKTGVNMGEDLIVSVQLCYYANHVTHIKQAFTHYNLTNTGSYTNLMSEKNLQDSVRSVEIIDEFLKSKSDYSDFIDGINQRKLMVKFRLTQQSRGELQKKYIKIYPEVDKMIFSAPRIPIYYKIALWLCAHNARALGNFIYSGVSKYKKMINK